MAKTPPPPMPDPLDELARQVETLAGQVGLVRDEAKAAKEALNEKVRTGTIILVVLALGLVVNLIVGGIAINASNNARAADKAIKKEARDTQLRDQAGLAGVCGVTNVNRIGNRNMLADINVNKPYDVNDTWPEFFAKWYAYWEPLNCRALVPESTAVQLCLQYPPTNDPATGKPVPTTADPINEKACEESEPSKNPPTTAKEER